MDNKIVSREDWLEARKSLQEKEKEFTRRRDELSEMKRSLPWLRIDKEYEFQSEEGKKTLKDLFGGRSQLIVYHFMFGPDWGDEGCKSCSFWADQYEQLIPHLNQRDVNLVSVSRGPLEKLMPFKQKMEWTFEWVSSFENDFNFDFDVTMKANQTSNYNYEEVMKEKEIEMPGISVFFKDDDGEIFHTYSCFARELETFNTVYRYLDIVPKGRDEDDLPYGMAWVKHRYKYQDGQVG